MLEWHYDWVDSMAAYDQYEVAIPLEKAGSCFNEVSDLLYGREAAWRGFRTPALVRFVGEEDGYLSPTLGAPRLYINYEDYVTYNAADGENEDFQKVHQLLTSEACGG
eukprot:CAMPEP_0183819348 /NCGR_PEP_ID=MMETSP0803_2-20130417/63932_1 /TAXON_ID=195967 /ORGANISM="Crustomastix stigmata, Strain CCMP3273" /LENGTH=107 /DNA_ID=CAMNT_0026064235 /DNA_START=8 /DNA_END=328 /DNA_ORIENTATION=-